MGLDLSTYNCDLTKGGGCLFNAQGTWWATIPVAVAGVLGIAASTTDVYGKALVLASVCAGCAGIVTCIVGSTIASTVWGNFPKYTVCAPDNSFYPNNALVADQGAFYYAKIGSLSLFEEDKQYILPAYNAGPTGEGYCYCTKFAGSGYGSVNMGADFKATQSRSTNNQTNCQSVLDFPGFLLAMLLFDVVGAMIAVVSVVYSIVILVTTPDEACPQTYGMSYALKTDPAHMLGQVGNVPVAQMGLNLVPGPIVTQYATVPGVMTTAPVAYPPQQQQQPQQQQSGPYPQPGFQAYYGLPGATAPATVNM